MLSKCSNLFAAAQFLGDRTKKGEGVAQPCRNRPQTLLTIHSFLRSDVLAVIRVVQIH